MKTVFVSLLAAAGLSLSACAHMGEETAALSVGEMRAELASVTNQLSDIEAAMKVDFSQGSARSRTTSWRRATLDRIRTLSARRDELNAEMKNAEAFTADEIRAQIQQIDTQLAKYGEVSFPSDIGPSGFYRASVPYAVLGAPSNPAYRYYLSDSTKVGTPINSGGPRASGWRRSYQLAEERKELFTMLQALENSQD